jgi:DNA-binding FadR family transcriptional regulator
MTSEKDRTLKLLEQHRNIFLAIEKQDPALAQNRMAEHLIWVDQKWRVFMQEKNQEA